MYHIVELHPKLQADLVSKHVDIERTQKIIQLEAENRHASTQRAPALELLPSDDPRIIKRHALTTQSVEYSRINGLFKSLDLPIDWVDELPRSTSQCLLDEKALETIGIRLYSKMAFGVLNGGMATSYTDTSKNKSLDASAMARLEAEFIQASELAAGIPKGIAPAFWNKDGSPGPSFLLLKLRSLLVKTHHYQVISGDTKSTALPFFQMSSIATHEPLQTALAEWQNSPLLQAWIEATGHSALESQTAIQPLLAALSHSKEGLPRHIFDRAWGKEHTGLALPGGHGENFRILAAVYKDLLKRGIRWASLGNVDNIAYTVDPVSLALCALTDAQAAFEFTPRGPLDVKGGALMSAPEGQLTIADIGLGISFEDIRSQEANGRSCLFNCATGLFDLEWLIPRLEMIADRLPLHISDQQKDAGAYAQAEQNTWEVLSLLERPLILEVDKRRRFLPAKMLLETLLSSPLSADLSEADGISAQTLLAAETSRNSLQSILHAECGYSLPDKIGQQRPLLPSEYR